ncbi:hypothetical protein KY309_03910 [Candidatus Woesearchaeota archaeon]|nr:hypothetical protein [Candidatus Woesearchaeota archaeon]
MKKSVTVILLLAIIALILAMSNGYQTLTGMQGVDLLDLPAPPAPPGMGEEQPAQQAPPPAPSPPVEYDYEYEEPEYQAPVYVPEPTYEAEEYLGIEFPEGEDLAAVVARLDAVEMKLAALDLLPAWEQRLNSLESQAAIASNVVARVDAMQSQLDALKVDVANLKQRPAVEAPTFDFSSLIDGVRRNVILSISFSVFALFIIAGLIFAVIINRRNVMIENKNLLRQYLVNYQKAGYPLETLRMHLRACGWKDDMINDVVKELPK